MARFMDSTFIQARIESTKDQIVAYESAAEALGVSGVQSYTIDTGQNRQIVTSADLDSIQKTIDVLYSRLCTLEARLTGSGVTVSRGCW